MSMPTKGKHHHLSHHHHPQHHQHQQPPQPHHTPPQHQHQIILNQPVVHSPQTYSAVVTTNTRFLNAGKSLFLPVSVDTSVESMVCRAIYFLALSDVRCYVVGSIIVDRERARGCPLVTSLTESPDGAYPIAHVSPRECYLRLGRPRGMWHVRREKRGMAISFVIACAVFSFYNC